MRIPVGLQCLPLSTAGASRPLCSSFLLLPGRVRQCPFPASWSPPSFLHCCLSAASLPLHVHVRMSTHPIPVVLPLLLSCPPSLPLLFLHQRLSPPRAQQRAEHPPAPIQVFLNRGPGHLASLASGMDAHQEWRKGEGVSGWAEMLRYV